MMLKHFSNAAQMKHKVIFIGIPEMELRVI